MLTLVQFTGDFRGKLTLDEQVGYGDCPDFSQHGTCTFLGKGTGCNCMALVSTSLSVSIYVYIVK